MFSYTAKLFVNSQRLSESGINTVYIRFYMDSKSYNINLEFKWPIDKIDFEKNRLLPTKKNDKVCEDYNMIIAQKFAAINDIFVKARLANQILGFDDFKAAINNVASREDFVQYWQAMLDNRKEKKTIRKSTITQHQSSLETLKKFCSTIPFYKLTRTLLEEYKSWMYNELNYDSDSTQTRLKNMRTYVKMAFEQKMLAVYPFEGFKMPVADRRIHFLNEEEFQKLYQYFRSGAITPGTNREKCLRGFLFMCYTGVRLGDFQVLTHDNIKEISGEKILFFKPQKNPKEMTKVVEVPLVPKALELIVTNEGKLFEHPSEAKIRQVLSEIATKLGISNTCSPHVARHTFATRFLRKGGRLEVLQELMGHSDIKTTMIYVHVNLQHKQEQMRLLD